MATVNSWLLAADDGGFNPLFLLLPLPWVGGIGFLAFRAKQTADRRADPANACRLGFTADEIEKMEELKRLRLQSDIKDYEEACAEAEATGRPKPNGLTWLEDKAQAAASKGYFGDGDNERPTMI